MPVMLPRNQPRKALPASCVHKKHIPKNMQKLMEKLEEAARNKDGCLDKSDVKEILKDLGPIFPAWRTHRAFGKADADKDGHISGEEIDSLLEYLRSFGFGK